MMQVGYVGVCILKCPEQNDIQKITSKSQIYHSRHTSHYGWRGLWETTAECTRKVERQLLSLSEVFKAIPVFWEASGFNLIIKRTFDISLGLLFVCLIAFCVRSTPEQRGARGQVSLVSGNNKEHSTQWRLSERQTGRLTVQSLSR